MVRSAQAITVLFTTSNPTTGAAADATGTPTGTLYVNGTANGATVTVTNVTTGVYKAALTLPSLGAGDIVSLRISATVASVAGEGVIWQDVGDTVRTSDTLTANPASGGIVAGSFGAGAINAAAIAADAITDAKVASDVTIASVTGAVGSVTAGVTLAASAIQAIWDAATSALSTVGSIGKWILDKLDVVLSTRLALASYTAPPTAAENADATLDALLSGHAIPGSAGAALSAAGGAADPLTNAVPGSYAAGSAGAALARIANEPISVTITSPVTSDGDFEMIVGDDWAVSESRQFDFALVGIVDLTGATVTWYTNLGGVTASKAMTIVTNTATTATVRLTLTASESAAWRAGIWAFGIRAVLSNAHVVTLVSGGRITVSPAVA